jgi:hypothetical protein
MPELCVFLEVWTGRKIPFLPVLCIAGEHFLKIGEKMQGNARDPLGVTREAGVAGKKQTAFQSRGNSTVEHSVRVIVPFEDVVQTGWHPAGNYGQHLHPAVAFPCTRADPASFIQGDVS